MIAVWCCSSVDFIVAARIHTFRGEVQFTIIDTGKADILWCRAVIAMAGLAAEMMTYKVARSGDCRQDLNQALEAARQLAKMCNAKEAFPIDPDMAICSLYSCPLTPDERHILGASYAKAKTILTRMEGPFLKMVSMLLTHRTITEKMAAEHLGPRGFILASTKGRFVLPDRPIKAGPVKPVSWLERMRGRVVAWFNESFSYSWP